MIRSRADERAVRIAERRRETAARAAVVLVACECGWAAHTIGARVANVIRWHRWTDQCQAKISTRGVQ